MQAALASGLALLAAGRKREAVVVLSQAAEAYPHQPALLRLNAKALLALGLRAPAIGALYTAAAWRPNDAGLQAELGDALLQDGQAEAALAACGPAYASAPTPAHAATLSAVLIDLGRDAEALDVIERGLARQAGCFELLMNRSIALEGLGEMPAATLSARAALASRPGNPLALHHLAAALLSQGELTAEAWRLYEGRLAMNGSRMPAEDRRRWTGGPIAGKTVLLHAEQGLGDTLQFVRYAPLVAGLGARVVLAVQKPLLRLLQATPGTEQVVGVGDALPPFDVYAPLLSLPGLFGTTLATIPPALPYRLPAGVPPAVGSDASSGALRVGLAWAGSAEFIVDRKRSLRGPALDSLAGVPGVSFHSLQRDPSSWPARLPITDLMDGVRDMADTAALVAGLDLVVTVDTAVAHLAGTMGKPVWLLSRARGCWRWLRDREDSPWYPGLRIIRQARANDWDNVLARVRRDLVGLVCAS